MNVLSLFNGISCARVALERAGIIVDKYYRSEIDSYANKIAIKNYPDSISLGDVTQIDFKKYYDWQNKIDLLIGGSPCQDLSIAKKNRQGLDGARSSLFYEYVKALEFFKPKYFILENVNSMKQTDRDLISKILDVNPIMINASLVSAQQRKRLFWTNIPGVIQPEDRNIYLKDILENADTDRLKAYCIDASYYNGANLEQYLTKKRRQLVFQKSKTVRSSGRGSGLGDKHNWDEYLVPKVFALTEARTDEAKEIRKQQRKETGKDYSPRRAKELVPRLDGKSNCLTTGITKEHLLFNDYVVRKLTPIECERLQGLPDNYTDGVSNTQRYKCLGNAFNVDVIAHILGFIK